MSDAPPDRLEAVANKADNWRKILSPIWVLAAGFVMLVFGFGQFYTQYQDNAQNGSPGVRALMKEQTDTLSRYISAQTEVNAKQQTTNDRLTNLIESQGKLQAMQYDEMDRRLQRIEDGKR